MTNVLLSIDFPSVKRRKYAPFGRVFVLNFISVFKRSLEKSATSFPVASNIFKKMFWLLKAGSVIVANPVAGFGEIVKEEFSVSVIADDSVAVPPKFAILSAPKVIELLLKITCSEKLPAIADINLTSN